MLILSTLMLAHPLLTLIPDEICVSKCGVQRYVLVDSSKFNVRPFIDKVMKIEDIHHVITNDDVSKENIDALKASGVDVL